MNTDYKVTAVRGEAEQRRFKTYQRNSVVPFGIILLTP
jgi:hypothetical protein